MTATISEDVAADALAALGNRTRLRLFKLLVRAGTDGLIVGEIQRQMELPASTLAHHLAALTRAGLVLQERKGREVVSTADYASMQRLLGWLTEECCAGVGGCGDGTCANGLVA